VFKITPSGKLTTLYHFCVQGFPSCPDGDTPLGLVEGGDGNFYGTTLYGGAHSHGSFGTVFKITANGEFSTLYSFCALYFCADGAFPSGLFRATDGNFYGETALGGGDYYACDDHLLGCGTVFEITPQGLLTTLHVFTGNNASSIAGSMMPDGANPSGLLQDTNGRFYGSTMYGGQLGDCSSGCGTLFSLGTGLGPFVAFVRAAGKVGQTGGILGQGFTGTTSVSFNGTPANFTVVSDTYLKATVPPGATTGYVTVTTPTGVLKSNVPFHVIP
jgi:uncharacterized repeat protein (TIGR03803 family)